MRSRATVQSPYGYDRRNLGAQQLAERSSLFKRSPAEIAEAVTPVDKTWPPGNPRRQGAPVDGVTSAVAELAIQQSTGEWLYLTEGFYLIDVDHEINVPIYMEKGAVFVIAAGVTLRISAQFEGSRTQHFSYNDAVTGVVRLDWGTVECLYPEWFGAPANSNADASTGTDVTAGFQRCIQSSSEDGAGAIGIHRIQLGSGFYQVGNLVFPPATCMVGRGRHTSQFVCAPGTSGKWFTDSNNAAKTVMGGFALYGNDEPGLTHGLQLGINLTEFGTEGYLFDLWIRDCVGIQLHIGGNVALMSRITLTGGTHSFVVVGAGNHVSQMVAYGASVRAIDAAGTRFEGLEVEAPGTGIIPIMVRGNCSFDGVTFSQAETTTFPAWVEFHADATRWDFSNCQFFGVAPCAITFSNFKRADGTYFGGNATNGSESGNGSYSSDRNGLRYQAWHFVVSNPAGTLQQKMVAGTADADRPALLAPLVRNKSTALVNLVTGADAATSMANGAKRGDTNSIIFFDVPDQEADYGEVQATICFNSTTTAVDAWASFVTKTINGVVRKLLQVQFFAATTGGAFNISTGNIGVGTSLRVAISGMFSP